MQALVYYRSIPRYLLAAGLNRLWPRHFFAGVAPLKLKQVEFSPPGPDWLVLKSRMCGLCGSDLRLLKGDLHTHTLASDGVLTAKELGWRAVRHGLDYVAITDHNTVEGNVRLR